MALKKLCNENDTRMFFWRHGCTFFVLFISFNCIELVNSLYSFTVCYFTILFTKLILTRQNNAEHNTVEHKRNEESCALLK